MRATNSKKKSTVMPVTAPLFSGVSLSPHALKKSTVDAPEQPQETPEIVKYGIAVIVGVLAGVFVKKVLF